MLYFPLVSSTFSTPMSQSPSKFTPHDFEAVIIIYLLVGEKKTVSSNGEKWTLSLGMKCLHEPWTANRWLVSFSGQSTPPRRQKDWKLAKFISEMRKSVVLLRRVRLSCSRSYFSLWEATSIVFITFCCNLYFDCDTRSKQDKRPYCSGSSEPFKPLSFRKRKREKAFRSCQLA